MKLSEVEKGMAVHVSGRFILDRPKADRRYVVVTAVDPMDVSGEADDYAAKRYPVAPEGFPEDGWIFLG